MVERESFAVIARDNCHSHSVIHRFSTSHHIIFMPFMGVLSPMHSPQNPVDDMSF